MTASGRFTPATGRSFISGVYVDGKLKTVAEMVGKAKRASLQRLSRRAIALKKRKGRK